ncbi:hypothetical protein EV363DRAFT_1303312 [Boletus edulis]|nr:hypothetical protein EV363DRAFT_1303312 [Boletus edulis]
MTHKNKTPPDDPSSPKDHTFSTPPSEPGPSHIPISPEVVRERLIAPAFSTKYAASPDVLQRVEFRRGKTADVLVVKGGADAEFTLRGVYQIARNDFYFTPDGNFDPANSFGSKFQDIKLSCRLGAPAFSVFQFAQNDYPACIQNFVGIEKLIKHDKNDEVMSTMSQHLGKTQFKLMHSLFDLKLDVTETPDEPESGNPDSETLTSNTEDDSLGPEFAMERWPVSPRCSSPLKDLFNTHDICPIPAFDTNGKMIPPSQYESALKGATVEIHFTFAHHYIKKNKRHVYSTLLRKLEVLRGPDPLPSSPFKRVRISATPTTKRFSRR